MFLPVKSEQEQFARKPWVSQIKCQMAAVQTEPAGIEWLSSETIETTPGDWWLSRGVRTHEPEDDWLHYIALTYQHDASSSGTRIPFCTTQIQLSLKMMIEYDRDIGRKCGKPIMNHPHLWEAYFFWGGELSPTVSWWDGDVLLMFSFSSFTTFLGLGVAILL